MNTSLNRLRWNLNSAEGRWKGFGPYYAMFPVSFAQEHIENYSVVGDLVLDPFCGRGTTNYISNLLGRDSVGFDINPVAWVYSKTKTDPAKDMRQILKRIDDIWESRNSNDSLSENKFQMLAWSPDVLAFLNSARRLLNWRTSKIDRTLAGIILVYLHGKLGQSLSNQMRQSRSMSPDYAVKWWNCRHMLPPNIDPVSYIKSRVLWRYKFGVPVTSSKSSIFLDDLRNSRISSSKYEPSLLLTSPPYMGVTNYKYDNWIRLWFLGGSPLPNWDHAQRFSNKDQYRKMIFDVFSKAKKIMKSDSTIVVRTDFRPFTLSSTASILCSLWPSHRLFGKLSIPTKPTQTALFGDSSPKPGELDILALPDFTPPPTGYLDIGSFIP